MPPGQTVTWLVLHRDVSGSVRVEQCPTVMAALVLDPDGGVALAAQVGETAAKALRDALAAAASQPADGREPATPDRVFCAAGLAAAVGRELDALGIAAPVEEVEAHDEAENVFDTLVGVLAGRRQPADHPSSADWSCLFTQALRYLERRPWERWADDVHLLLDLRVDASRTEMLGVVLGNAGHQRGLVLYPGPGSLTPPEPADSSVPAPPGTILMGLDREGVPPDLAARARRYGWPADEDLVPTFFGITRDGPSELDEQMARQLTVALAAIVEHDGRGLQVATTSGPQSRGTLLLAGGRRGRYRLQVEANQPDAVAGGVHLFDKPKEPPPR
jgi:hypothetical protein